MTEEDETDYRNTSICRFCEKISKNYEVSDHCHITGKYKSSAHNSYNFNVTQKQSSFLPFFHKFGKLDCHLFFKKKVS